MLKGWVWAIVFRFVPTFPQQLPPLIGWRGSALAALFPPACPHQVLNILE